MAAPKLNKDPDRPTSAMRILERAIEVINQGGEVAIRTNLIAEECGVTAPILYRAFGSREGLVIAAQTERYRRSTAAAAEFLIAQVEKANSREELRANIAAALDFIFSPERIANRRVRAEVIGSAVSRREIARAVAQVDAEFSASIAAAYGKAKSAGWIAEDLDITSIAIWAQGITNSRVAIEFSGDEKLAANWDALTRTAIFGAIFGD